MPQIARWVPLAVIFINILFFVTANFFSVGASVLIKLGILGDLSQPVPLLEFTLETSVDDMWNADAYFLSIAIALASGAWPYLKNIMLLFCWFAPPTVLASKKRHSLLEMLDALGKWSLIDVYVLVMLTVAFRFYISSSYLNGLDELFAAQDLVIVDVVVAPGWGIYGFCFGAIGSLLINHYMIIQVEKIDEFDEMTEDKITGTYVAETAMPKIALRNHRFGCADTDGKVYGFGPATQLTVGALLVISSGLLLIGSVLDLITFNFTGIAGIAISIIDADLATVTYSLVSIATAMVEGSDPAPLTRLGILFLQIVYLLFAIIVPLILMGVWATLWYYPMHLEGQKRLIFVSKILGAWEAVVVFAISVLGAILQISAIAQFIVLNSTGSICSTIEQQLSTTQISPADSKCFDVSAELETTGIFLIMGAALMFVTNTMMFRLTGAAVEDRRNKNKRKECKNPKDYPNDILRKLVLKVFTMPVARIRVNRADIAPADSDSMMAAKNPMYDVPV
jgi:hypothetical protein